MAIPKRNIFLSAIVVVLSLISVLVTTKYNFQGYANVIWIAAVPVAMGAIFNRGLRERIYAAILLLCISVVSLIVWGSIFGHPV